MRNSIKFVSAVVLHLEINGFENDLIKLKLSKVIQIMNEHER